MNPTPEQVAQWALEERLDPGVYYTFRAEEITRLVTRAMAEQAEADAKLSDLPTTAPKRWKSSAPTHQR